MDGYEKLYNKIPKPKPLRLLNVAIEQLLLDKTESQKALSQRDKNSSRNLS